MKVRLSKAAIRDFASIQTYIATDDPAAALNVVSRLERAVILISERPLIGRPTPRPDTREWSVPGLPYVIPYRVLDDTVEIAASSTPAGNVRPNGSVSHLPHAL